MSRARQPAVRITDLADPQWSPQAAEIRGFLALAGESVVIDDAAVLATAVERTGLDDFGDPWFREPLAVVCRSQRAEAELSEVRAAMDAFMADHPRGRHGTVHYDLAGFGVDPEERRDALAFYRQRFGV